MPLRLNDPVFHALPAVLYIVVDSFLLSRGGLRSGLSLRLNDPVFHALPAVLDIAVGSFL